jgi:uncharacterized protein DUF4255
VADFRAVYSVGNAIAKFLNDHYPPQELKGQTLFDCNFRLISSHDIASEDAQNLDKVVSVFLHRVTRNEQVRTASRAPDRADAQPLLFLDLHYLITYWGSSAEAEQVILTWVMQQLESNPVLDSSTLSGADGSISESVQLVPTNLSLEDILRIWDALGPKYRLSISYIARYARVDRIVPAAGPVVATRFKVEDQVGQ